MHDNHLGTIFTALMGICSSIMAFFDTHAAGLGVMIAFLSLFINALITIYFKRKGK